MITTTKKQPNKKTTTMSYSVALAKVAEKKGKLTSGPECLFVFVSHFYRHYKDHLRSRGWSFVSMGRNHSNVKPNKDLILEKIKRLILPNAPLIL